MRWRDLPLRNVSSGEEVARMELSAHVFASSAEAMACVLGRAFERFGNQMERITIETVPFHGDSGDWAGPGSQIVQGITARLSGERPAIMAWVEAYAASAIVAATAEMAR